MACRFNAEDVLEMINDDSLELGMKVDVGVDSESDDGDISDAIDDLDDENDTDDVAGDEEVDATAQRRESTKRSTKDKPNYTWHEVTSNGKSFPFEYSFVIVDVVDIAPTPVP